MCAATKETISMANKEEEPKIDLSQLSEEDQKEWEEFIKEFRNEK